MYFFPFISKFDIKLLLTQFVKQVTQLKKKSVSECVLCMRLCVFKLFAWLSAPECLTLALWAAILCQMGN